MTENGTPMYMPVAPAYNTMGGNGGFFGGDNGWWIILLFLLAGNGGWGFGGGMNGGMFPWMMGGMANTNNDVQRGFDQSAVINGITGVQNAVTNGFGNVQTALCNGFAQAEIANNARQMTDMQQNFALQTQLANCCCENRAATADLKYTVATENCADRNQSMMNTRDIIEAVNANGQKIQDKLCQLELDGVKQNYENRIAGMQNMIDGLNAQVNASDRRVAIGEEVDALYNRLNNCPVPSMPVYGRTPIFTCNGNNQGCCCGIG